MKRNLLQSCAWLLIMTLGFALSPIRAQDAPPPENDGPGGEKHHHMDFLTAAEKQELKAAREAVLAANPDLKTQEQSLHQEGKALRDNPNATPEDKKAFFEKMQDFHKTMEEAMLKQDPNLQPIFDKIKAHREEWKANHPHPDDAPPAN